MKSVPTEFKSGGLHENHDDDYDNNVVVVVVLVDPQYIQNGFVHAVETNRPVGL